MARRSSSNRPAFSLLEMVLALAIGMLLLAALYQTLYTQVQFAQIGRDAISEADLARSVLTRISDDIANQLGILDPRVLPVYETTDPAATDPAATDPATTTTTTPATTPMTTEMTPSGVTFNVVRGDANRLTLAVYRVQPGQAAGDEVVSDLRRVSYWLVNNGDQALGLARYETKRATAAEIDLVPTDLPDQNKLVIAKEVKEILFEYFDGKAWQPTWEGTTPGGAESNIPMGPPAAIAITITLRAGGNRANADGTPMNEGGTTYKQVVALPAGNNYPGAQASP